MKFLKKCIFDTDKGKSARSKDLLKNFARFIEYYRPGFVLVENVPGILTNKNSILPFFLKKLEDLGYRNIVSYYGVPHGEAVATQTGTPPTGASSTPVLPAVCKAKRARRATRHQKAASIR